MDFIPPLRRLTRNEHPTHTEHNRLAATVEGLGGAEVVHPAEIAGLLADAEFLIRITGGSVIAAPGEPRAYAYVIQFPAGDGIMVDHPTAAGGDADPTGVPAYEASGNPHVPIDGTVTVRARRRGGELGDCLEFDRPRPPGVWVRLSGNAGADYGFVEQYRDTATTWDDLPGGFTGTPTVNRATEIGGVTGLPDGTVVQIYRGYSSGAAYVAVNRTLPGDGVAVNEIQTVAVVGAVGGTFTLTFEGLTTAAIAYNAAAAAIKAALESLSNLGTVTVTGTGTTLDPFVVEFSDDFLPRGLMQPDRAGLVNDQRWLFRECCGVTVEEVDGTPTYPATATLRFDQGDGFVVTQPAAGVARVDQTPASATTVGYVDLGAQRLGTGEKGVDALFVGTVASLGSSWITTYVAGINGLMSLNHPAGAINPHGYGIVFETGALGAGANFAQIFLDDTNQDLVLSNGVPGPRSSILRLHVEVGVEASFDLSQLGGGGSPFFSVNHVPGVWTTFAGMTVTGGLITGGTFTGAVTTNPLSQFAATTSAQLAGVITDETGTGLLVFNASPTLQPSAAGNIGATVKGAGSQTANLIEIQKSDATVYGGWTANGYLFSAKTTTPAGGEQSNSTVTGPYLKSV